MKEIAISRTELFLLDPFMALQLPIAIVDDLKVKSYNADIDEQISVDVDACQLGLDTISLKQIYLIIEKMKHILDNFSEFPSNTDTTFIERPQLLICNNLNRKIRIKQKQDNFLKMSDTAKVGGIGFGEAVLLKLLPIKPIRTQTNDEKMNPILNEKIELVLGLCSELKGSIKWTESVELPLLNFNYVSESGSNLGIWRLDTNNKSDVCLSTNSSSFANSVHARNLFFIHNYDPEGLNKVSFIGVFTLTDDDFGVLSILFIL